jgi:hypothetical protein
VSWWKGRADVVDKALAAKLERSCSLRGYHGDDSV